MQLLFKVIKISQIFHKKIPKTFKHFSSGAPKWNLNVFENRILRKIFGATRDENAERRRFHNEELHSLYYASNTIRVIKIRRLRWAGHVARMEEARSACKILGGKPTRRRPLGRQMGGQYQNEPYGNRYQSMRGIWMIRFRIRIIGESP